MFQIELIVIQYTSIHLSTSKIAKKVFSKIIRNTWEQLFSRGQGAAGGRGHELNGLCYRKVAGNQGAGGSRGQRFLVV